MGERTKAWFQTIRKCVGYRKQLTKRRLHIFGKLMREGILSPVFCFSIHGRKREVSSDSYSLNFFHTSNVLLGFWNGT